MDRLFRERIKELATFITEDAIAQLPVIMRHRLLYYTDAVINLVFRGKLLELPALLSLQTAELDAMWCCTDDLRILIEKKIFTFSDVMALDIEPRKEVLVSCYFLIKATEKNVCTLDEIAEYFSNHTPTACLGYFSRESWAYNISRIFDEDRFCQFKDVACLNEETLSELALYRKQVSRLVHVHKIPFLEIAEANPDQFKHFLALAETNAEKSAQQTKRTTPGVQQFQLPPPDPSDAAVVANTAPVVSI